MTFLGVASLPSGIEGISDQEIPIVVYEERSTDQVQ